MEMFHAHDERVPIDGLAWGVKVLYEVVEAYCRG
jgi:acetylornithine deacetylase/succinyl-diaminopimelate desuccinylase-like protein